MSQTFPGPGQKAAILQHIGLGGNIRPAVESVRRASIGRFLVEDYRPLGDSLEWHLSRLNWMRLGVMPFASGDVPFLANNDGRLSSDAAAILFANCQESEPSGDRIVVLELGAGSGLFARYFLDEFRHLSEQTCRDYYERLLYFVTDISPATVQFWERAEIFREHAEHVALRVYDAREAGELQSHGVRALLCNYVLDSLPAAVLRRTASGWEQRCARTWITDDAAVMRQYTPLSGAEIQRLAASGAPADHEQLLPILPLLETEYDSFPVGLDVPPGIEKLDTATMGDVFTYNYAAMACLDAYLDVLDPAGFVLINDYGPTISGNLATSARGKRFGPCHAIGLNFLLIERRLENAGILVCKAEGDDESPIHARLLLREGLSATQSVFENRFSKTARRWFSEPIEQARAQAESGLLREPLELYRTAIERSPRDWQLIADAATFVATRLGDPANGLELAQAGVELNPWYSADLWNVLGECLDQLGRHTQAHECYLQACRVDPRSVSTYLKLAGSWLQMGDPARSLEAVAQGLATDTNSMFRHKLLDKQQDAISALATRWNLEHEREARRNVFMG